MEVYSYPQTGPLPGPPGSFLSGLSAHNFLQIKYLLLQKLCCVCTRQQYSASLDYCVTSLPPYVHQFSTISGGELYQINKSHHSTPKLGELLMPSPELLDLTLSDDKIQPDHIQSDCGTSTPTRARNRFRTSSSTPSTSGINRAQRILPVIQGILQPSNKLKIISHSNLSSMTLTLDKHSSTASTTNTGLAYLTSTLWRPASTHTPKMVLSQRVCED